MLVLIYIPFDALTTGTFLWLPAGDLFHSAGPHEPERTQLKSRERIRAKEGAGGGGGGVNRPERQILEQKTKTFLAVREACVATFWPTRGFEGRTFVSSGFSTEGYFNLCVRSAPLRSRERPRGREWGGGGGVIHFRLGRRVGPGRRRCARPHTFA